MTLETWMNQIKMSMVQTAITSCNTPPGKWTSYCEML